LIVNFDHYQQKKAGLKVRLTGFTLLFLIFLITPSFSQGKRKVLVEEFSGIWCGDCPNGRTATEHLDATFHNSVICISMHSADSLANPYSEGIVTDCNVTEFPLGFIDRTSFHQTGGVFQEMGMDGTDWDEQVKERLNITTPLELKISNSYSKSSRELHISVRADFLTSYSGNMRFNCILVEDSIPSDNMQRNYNNQNSASPWYQKGDPILNYFQRDVARVNLSGNIWGDENIIPVNVLPGEGFSQNYYFQLPSIWNDSHVKIVAFISNWGNSPNAVDTSQFSIVNAEVARLNPQLLTGINSTKGLELSKPYPNPFSNTISFPIILDEDSRLSLKIYDVLGVEVSNLCDQFLASGDHNFTWPGTLKNGDLAPNGLYICKLNSSKSSFSCPIILNR
jgi:hypothetical protein